MLVRLLEHISIICQFLKLSYWLPQQWLDPLSYDERMHRLGLPSLELRRLHLDLIFGYKVVFGLVGVNTDDFFEFNHAANTNTNTNSEL